jgi:hypothetical protein
VLGERREALPRSSVIGCSGELGAISKMQTTSGMDYLLFFVIVEQSAVVLFLYLGQWSIGLADLGSGIRMDFVLF